MGLPRDPTEIRRALGWALVAGLTVAALTASFALLSGSFDDTDGRVIFSSLGFCLYSGVSATGASLRLRTIGAEQQLGAATVAVATFSFGLFLVALWSDSDSETLWRVVGSTAVAALAGSHACLVVGARRASDTPLVSGLATASLALGAADAFIAVLAITGAIEDVDDGQAQFFGVLLIALLLTTTLAPILRRLQRQSASTLAEEVLAAADRIDELNRGPGIRAPEIRKEVERLRALARGYAER
jgi:hypothetical protein